MRSSIAGCIACVALGLSAFASAQSTDFQDRLLPSSAQLIGAPSSSTLLGPTARAEPSTGSGFLHAPVLNKIESGGVTYELSTVHRVIDPRTGTTHLAMKVLNDPRGYAFLSMDGQQRMVGTLHTSTGTVEIDRDGLARPAAREADPAMRELRRRHDRIVQLSEIQPEIAMSSEHGRSLHIRGGQLGQLAEKQILSGLRAALQRVALLNYMPSATEIRIVGDESTSDLRAVDFEQVIDGVPVWKRNRVLVSNDGRIIEMSTQFVDPARAQSGRLMKAGEAVNVATDALEEKFKSLLPYLKLLRRPALHYYDVPGESALAARYVVAADVGEHGIWRVLVDAATGETEIVDPAQPAAGFVVCYDPLEGTQPTTPSRCTDPTGVDVYVRPPDTAASTCVLPNRPKDPTPCRLADTTGADIGLNTALGALEVISQTYPSLCCNNLGGADRSIDVVVRTGAATSGVAYYPDSESIMSPPGNTGFRSIESLWHELGHHVLHVINPHLMSLYNGPGEVFASSFIEAYADLIQAAISETAPSTGTYTYGDPWFMGDGANGSANRDLYDESFTFVRLTENLSNHARGQAITTYFYKVKQMSGMSTTRFMQLLAQLGANLRDFDGNGLDLIDFKGALLLSASPSETALREAINSKFDEMYAPLPGSGSGPLPIPVPPSPGAPPPPSPVTVAPAGCAPGQNGSVLSKWHVQWQPVAGATHYVGYFKFRFSTYIQDTTTTSLLETYAETNTPAWVFFASCNASGCGNTSNQALITHRPDCGGG
jgi:hypothetical protein